MQHENRLLVGALDRHKAHVRPRNGLANRLRIPRIVLVALHVRPYELRRHQLGRVPQFAQFARPKMRAAASFHPHQTRLQLGKEAHHLCTLQHLAQYRLAPIIHSVHLKQVLCQIKTNCCNIAHGWLLLLVIFDDHHLGTSMPPGSHPPHQSGNIMRDCKVFGA